MHKFATRLALLTVIGAMGATAAPSLSFAAPPPGGPGVDCKDPANAKNPACLMPGMGMHHKPGPNDHKGPSGNMGGNNPPPPPTNTNNPPPPPNNNGNPPPPHNGNPPPPPHSGNNNFPFGGPNWNFSQHDRDQFHQRFNGLNFGFFPAPNFSITLGYQVPHHYNLRPVPRNIYRYYPQFRGYLFFVARNGDIVIVNPRTYRIVAIL